MKRTILATGAVLTCLLLFTACSTGQKKEKTVPESEQPPHWRQAQDADRASLDALVHKTGQQIQDQPH